MTNLVSKLSVAKCHGKLNMSDLPKGPFLRVIGVARGTKEGVSTYGPWTSLLGDFYAINTQTGEEFRSGQCFLPDTANNLVIGALKGSPDGVEFAFDIGVKPSAKEPETKYEYTVAPVIKVQENDQMASLLAQAAEAKPLAIGNETGADKKAKK